MHLNTNETIKLLEIIDNNNSEIDNEKIIKKIGDIKVKKIAELPIDL
jgi:hypothetical protein